MATIPNTLKEVLARQDVFKVGLAVLDDSKKLITYFGIDVVSCVDLRHLVVRYRTHEGKLGLEVLAFMVLGVKLDKDWKLRAGDWESETLSTRQVEYAANDALVAVNIAWVIVRNHLTGTMASWVRAVMWDMEQYKLATEGVEMPESGEEQFDLEAYRNIRQVLLGVNPRGSREHSVMKTSFVRKQTDSAKKKTCAMNQMTGPILMQKTSPVLKKTRSGQFELPQQGVLCLAYPEDFDGGDIIGVQTIVFSHLGLEPSYSCAHVALTLVWRKG